MKIRSLLNRLFAAADGKRSLDAAAGGRRWEGGGWLSNINADVAAGSTTVRRRAAYYFRNNPHASRASDVLVTNIIGTGIRPQSQHPEPSTRDAIDVLFARWEAEADASGTLGFYGLQALGVRSLFEAGEAFIRFRPRLPDGLAVPMQLQVLDPAQIDPALHRDLGDGVRIRSGVEFDALGRRLAYHILPEPPGEPFPSTLTPVRMPAEDIIHVLQLLAPGQIRGLSWLLSVLLRLHDLDAYEDAQLMRQKVAAMFAGFIFDPDGTASAFSGDQENSVLKSGMEPGTLKVVPPGYDIKFSEPAEAGQSYEPFIKQQLRSIAAAVGITYEQLTGDMTGVNYSSARVALIEFRRRIEALQQHVVIHQLCRPVWKRFVDTAVLAGALPADAYERDPQAFYAVRWVPQGWQWVDPLKDVQADRLAVEAGFKSRAEVVAERGRDPDKVDAELAEDAGRAKTLGIATVFSTTPTREPSA